jgi:hypothetical protein
MAFNRAQIQELPDLACVGIVKRIGDGKPSKTEGSPYHVMAIEVKAQGIGKDGTFYWLYQPDWFRSDFDPRSLGDGVLYSMYGKHFAHSKKPSILEALANCAQPSGFDKLAEQFQSIEAQGITDETVTELLREFLTGAEVGFISGQRKDEGELTEQYQINRFFVPDEDGIAAVEREAANARRKKPLKITWQEQ